MTIPSGRPNIERFASKFIEGYLFHDLAAMAKVEARPPPDRYGDLSYPIVQTCLAGIELLGGLLNTEPFKGWKRSEHYFCSYWSDYMSQVDRAYGKALPSPKQIYALARNGVAHQFLTKPGIDVVKRRDRAGHLTVDSAAEWTITVDCLLLAEDLQDSYLRFVRPLIYPTAGGSPTAVVPGRDSINDRLQEMLEDYETEGKKFMGRLPRYQG